MNVTKCFATFIVTPKDLLCYTAQPEPTASDPKCSHILQSDMKETVVNESATWVFEKKCPFCKESQWKVNQKHQPLISCTIESCEDSMKNIITNSDDQKLGYEYWNIDVPANESQSSPQMLIEIYISSLKVKIPGHCHSWWYLHQHIHFHTFKHVSLMNLNQNPLLFPIKGSFGTSAHTEI